MSGIDQGRGFGDLTVGEVLFLHISLAALLVSAFLLATPASAIVINRVIATVDGEPITMYELRNFEISSIRGRQAGAAMQESPLDILITDKLIEKEAAAKGVIVREEDVNLYIEDIKTRNKLSDEQLDEALQAQGVTLDEYRKQIRQEIERQQLIAREIRGKVNVTPEEVQRYYEAHLSDYATPARFKIAHIVFQLPEDASANRRLAAEEEAQTVYDEIEDGADFAEMARLYSQDSTADAGGELGWFEPGQLVESLADAAEGLDVGEVSPPVPGPAGLHIIKLLDREDASHRDLSELEAEIKEKLYAQALEQRFEKWMKEELRNRHDVDIRP